MQKPVSHLSMESSVSFRLWDGSISELELRSSLLSVVVLCNHGREDLHTGSLVSSWTMNLVSTIHNSRCSQERWESIRSASIIRSNSFTIRIVMEDSSRLGCRNSQNFRSTSKQNHGSSPRWNLSSMILSSDVTILFLYSISNLRTEKHEKSSIRSKVDSISEIRNLSSKSMEAEKGKSEERERR